MPVIVSVGAFRVVILNPPREHGPAHVHVIKGPAAGESEVLVNLGQPDVAGAEWHSVSVREIKAMRPSDVVTAVKLVQSHLLLLRERWREIHGET
jgi:hypothetical protein